VVEAKRLGIGREEMLASIAEHWQRLSKDPPSKDSQAAGKTAEEGRRER
jgi:hypothetical protein